MIERYTRPRMGRIWSEQTKLEKWLQVEIAVCQAWAEVGRIAAHDLEGIRNATFNVEDVASYLQETHHDMTAFLRSVADSLGPESRFVHLGLTSSDVMDTGLALQLLDATALLEEDLEVLLAAVKTLAIRHRRTPMMGRTHGVHAEPTSFGMVLAVWVDEIRRHQHRLEDARQTVAVGKISGAVGSHATISPDLEERVCTALGLAVEPISTQIVHRDRHAQFVSTLAQIAASLDKFATEIRHLQRTEVLEAEEPFARGQTGSSAMPHKRNPEKCERISGLARLFRGYNTVALENVPLWHERDISHSSTERVIIPDSCTLLDYMLDLFSYVISGLQVYPQRMTENMEGSYGLIFSQRILLALVEKGLSREAAYKLVQRNAMKAWRERMSFYELLIEDAEVATHIPQEELAALFDYDYYLQHVDDSFQRIGLYTPSTDCH